MRGSTAHRRRGGVRPALVALLAIAVLGATACIPETFTINGCVFDRVTDPPFPEDSRIYTADCPGADLRWASLSGIDLYLAEFTDANLRSANLRGTGLIALGLWGADDLGVLLYGHAKNALWYGSRLTIQETRDLAPYQNATGLQVTSAVIAGMAWALANPRAGIVEADEMDHDFCLQVQRPYLGRVEAHYTDWTPISTRWAQFEEEIDEADPWQFKNVLAT